MSSQCEYFSGLGNILSFLLSTTLQIGQVKFLQRVAAEDQSDDKDEDDDDDDDDDDDSPTFLISVEVGYEAAGLAALLQWVQRARLERNTGHLAVYTVNTQYQ